MSDGQDLETRDAADDLVRFFLALPEDARREYAALARLPEFMRRVERLLFKKDEK